MLQTKIGPCLFGCLMCKQHLGPAIKGLRHIREFNAPWFIETIRE